MPQIEQWAIFEQAFAGPTEGNPFVDVTLTARFSYKHRVVETDGFYDGNGTYRIRCMPDTPGEWTYITQSNVTALDSLTGSFTCTAPAATNHGPVGVHKTYHFAYADSTPYIQFGTTCYVWNHQGAAREQQTLATLKTAPFNKLRMCVFPKDYVYNQHEPEFYPFVGEPLTDWDFTRFDPAYFQHLEKLIGALRDLNIEADIILFHPYDRWGFSQMDAAADDRYLRYVVARLAPFRNVWWSMANEFDVMRAKTEADWDRFFRIVQESDPYQHLRSVHNCYTWYDHNKPWVTHASVQAYDVEHTDQWRERYRKPIVIDECRYEGNVPSMWGNITAQDMTRLFWEGTLRGGYVGHGETYLHPDDVLWWSHGGELHGASPARIAFLREIVGDLPLADYTPIASTAIIEPWHDYACLRRADDHFLVYFGRQQPGQAQFKLPESHAYRVTLIDTWAMTHTTLPDTYAGSFTLDLPGQPYIACSIEKI
ncbi:MAG: DUF5060 domain-containing protein [Anaerolineae bacterium]|nr:DUF5060 domain-containing protein [Anaerolineae bacterium]